MFTIDEFDSFIAGKKAEAAEKKSTANSTGLQAEVFTNLANTPDYQSVAYLNDAETPVKDDTVNKFRGAVTNAVGRALKLDKQSLEEAKEKVEFTKSEGDALAKFAQLGTRKYLETGRRLTLEPTTPDEARMSIMYENVPEKVAATTKIEQQADGSYKVVPTGKEVTTLAHTNLKAGNKTRPWHKKIKTL